MKQLKHIKSINEYRTLGFRYSEPTDKFNVIIAAKNSINKSDVEKILNDYRITFEGLEIVYEKVPTKSGISDIIIDIDILVYTEKEIQDIMDSIIKELTVKYKLDILDAKVTPN